MSVASSRQSHAPYMLQGLESMCTYSVKIKSISFQALAIWWCSRLFCHVKNKSLIYDITDNNLSLAMEQAQALWHFFSMPFISWSFTTMHIGPVDAFSPPQILQLLRLVDNVGCRAVSIYTGLLKPEWFHMATKSCTLKYATVSMFHLESLYIHNQYLSVMKTI